MARPLNGGLSSSRSFAATMCALLGARRGVEPVTRAAYGDDALGIVLASQPDDARINRAVESVRAFGRSGGDDVVARQHLAGIGEEQPEERDLAWRQALLDATAVHDESGLEVDGRVFE